MLYEVITAAVAQLDRVAEKRIGPEPVAGRRFDNQAKRNQGDQGEAQLDAPIRYRKRDPKRHDRSDPEKRSYNFV